MKEDTKVYYDQKEVGKRIQNVRKNAGVTQEYLADELHISREMLSRIENGKNSCGPDLLIYLCRRFERTADYFYFGDEYEKEEKTRIELINELLETLRTVDGARLWEIYKIVKILVKI